MLTPFLRSSRYTKVTKWEDVQEEAGVGGHAVEEMGLSGGVLERLREVVRDESGRLADMRRAGLFHGEDCGWQ